MQSHKPPNFIEPSQLPKHRVDRFESYTDIEVGDRKGFVLDDGTEIFFDLDGGWADELGCYYNKDVEPIGWLVKSTVDHQVEHFYNMQGTYVASDDDDNNDLNDYDLEDLNVYGDAPHQSTNTRVVQQSSSSTQQPKQAPQERVEQQRTKATLKYKFQLINSTDAVVDLKLLESFLTGRDLDNVIESFMAVPVQQTLLVSSAQVVDGFKKLPIGTQFEYSKNKKAKPV